jgi:uncharacterized membrane protein
MLPVRQRLIIAALSTALAGGTMTAIPALAQSTMPEPPKLTGLWLTTDFPMVTHAIGDDVALDIVMENRNLPPQKVKLNVEGLPDQWRWEFKGEGQTVGAATVRPDQVLNLKLDVTPPKDAKPGSYSFKVSGVNGTETFELPVTLNLTAKAEAKVSIEPKLPALRGTPKSNFDFDLAVKNDSKDDQIFNLLADAPAGFQATFKEQYGSAELASIPVKAGETKNLKLTVELPRNLAAGQYPVKAAVASPAISANTDLLLDVTGQPDLALEAADGRLSGEATAGKERSFNFQVANNGTAEAKEVKLNATSPNGWKVTFSPETIPQLAPGQKFDVAVNMTPADKAITGDYMVTVRADGEGASDSSEFRVTVKTSTAWGIAGLGIIGASLLAFGASVARYGRR